MISPPVAQSTVYAVYLWHAAPTLRDAMQAMPLLGSILRSLLEPREARGHAPCDLEIAASHAMPPGARGQGAGQGPGLHEEKPRGLELAASHAIPPSSATTDAASAATTAAATATDADAAGATAASASTAAATADSTSSDLASPQPDAMRATLPFKPSAAPQPPVAVTRPPAVPPTAGLLPIPAEQTARLLALRERGPRAQAEVGDRAWQRPPPAAHLRINVLGVPTLELVGEENAELNTQGVVEKMRTMLVGVMQRPWAGSSTWPTHTS